MNGMKCPVLRRKCGNMGTFSTSQQVSNVAFHSSHHQELGIFRKTKVEKKEGKEQHGFPISVCMSM